MIFFCKIFETLPDDNFCWVLHDTLILGSLTLTHFQGHRRVNFSHFKWDWESAENFRLIILLTVVFVRVCVFSWIIVMFESLPPSVLSPEMTYLVNWNCLYSHLFVDRPVGLMKFAHTLLLTNYLPCGARRTKGERWHEKSFWVFSSFFLSYFAIFFIQNSMENAFGCGIYDHEASNFNHKSWYHTKNSPNQTVSFKSSNHKSTQS